MERKRKSIKIEEIEDYLKGLEMDFKIYGNKELEIFGFSSLNHYQKGTLTWIKETQERDK